MTSTTSKTANGYAPCSLCGDKDSVCEFCSTSTPDDAREHHMRALASPRVRVAELAAAVSAGATDAQLRRQLVLAAVAVGATDTHDQPAEFIAAKVAAIAVASERGQFAFRDLADKLGHFDRTAQVALDELVESGVLDKLEYKRSGRTVATYYMIGNAA